MVGRCGGEAAKHAMRVERLPRRITKHPVDAREGWGATLARPSISPSVKINIAQLLISEEAAESGHDPVIEPGVILVCCP